MDNLINYIMGLLRYNLFNDSDQNNEYEIRVKQNGIYFIPIMPTTYIINEELYNKIFNILSVGLMPVYTLLRPLTMQLVTFEGEDISRQRALYFPFYNGRPERLVGSINDMINLTLQTGQIPLMRGMSVKPCHACISGPTGSGKSYFLKHLFRCCDTLGSTIIIDPKQSDLSRMTQVHSVKQVVIPDFTNNSDKGIGSRYSSEVVDVLKQQEAEMYSRQALLFSKSKKISTDYTELGLKPIFIFIDELAALSTGNKKISNDLFSTLTRIALLGRESGIFLILSLQSARAEFIPDIIRQQCSLKVLLGRINRQTAQFLFPELNADVPMIPIGGKGTGIVSIAGDERFSGIQPLATPTITKDN